MNENFRKALLESLGLENFINLTLNFQILEFNGFLNVTFKKQINRIIVSEIIIGVFQNLNFKFSHFRNQQIMFVLNEKIK